jgi:hypothetical protein
MQILQVSCRRRPLAVAEIPVLLASPRDGVNSLGMLLERHSLGMLLVCLAAGKLPTRV